MIKKTSFYLLIFSFFNYAHCSFSKEIDKNIFFSESDDDSIDEITIVTSNNDRIKIDEITYKILDDTVYLKGINKTNVEVYNQPVEIEIALADIQSVEIDERNHLATLGIFLGATALVLILLLVIVGNSAEKSPNSCNDMKDL